MRRVWRCSRNLTSSVLGPLDADMAQTEAWVRAGWNSPQPQGPGHEPLQSVPMPGAINTLADEYYGALSLDGRHMILTRAGRGLQQTVGGEDFFESSMNDAGEWSPPVLLRGVNTRQNEGAPTWTGDGRTMIFTACASPRDGYGRRRGKGSCDLFETTWNPSKGEWGVGRNLGAPNSAGWESQPSVSADGQTLVFAQSSRGRNKPSDLVMCRRMASGGMVAAGAASRVGEHPLHRGKPVFASRRSNPLFQQRRPSRVWTTRRVCVPSSSGRLLG